MQLYIFLRFKWNNFGKEQYLSIPKKVPGSWRSPLLQAIKKWKIDLGPPAPLIDVTHVIMVIMIIIPSSLSLITENHKKFKYFTCAPPGKSTPFNEWSVLLSVSASHESKMGTTWAPERNELSTWNILKCYNISGLFWNLNMAAFCNCVLMSNKVNMYIADWMTAYYLVINY